jgi:hypothetical protein
MEELDAGVDAGTLYTTEQQTADAEQSHHDRVVVSEAAMFVLVVFALVALADSLTRKKP